MCADLVALPADVAAVQGRITVPRPQGRRPTDAERNTIALENARWITADLAVRRSALEDVGGFDTRFPRAYREDTDLALRLWDAGFTLRKGQRECVHPLREEDGRAGSVAQKGNADNALMRRLHGPGWRERVGEAPGRLRSHLVTTALLTAGVGAVISGHRRLAAVLGIAWAGRTARFALERAMAGPNDPAEWLDMALTSALIPPLACWHRAAGELRHAGAGPRPPVRAVLFDRDGTLVEDVPYNNDPDKVVPRPGATEAVALAREHGLAVGVVTNQSGVGRGLLTERELAAVTAGSRPSSARSTCSGCVPILRTGVPAQSPGILSSPRKTQRTPTSTRWWDIRADMQTTRCRGAVFFITLDPLGGVSKPCGRH